MKANVRYLILVSLSLLLPVNTICQKILYPECDPPDGRWDNFLLKGGEASQSSLSLLIDSKGFLWSGTETGLYRYDGTRYVEYGVSNTTNKGFTGFTVTYIFEDSESTIWIGTSEALNKLDQKTGIFLHYIPDSVKKSGISNFIRCIREDRNGLLWVLTKKDIFSLDRKLGKFTRYAIDSLSWYPQNYDDLSQEQCYAEDSHGNKWFVTYRGLYHYNHQDKIFRMVIPDPGNAELKDVDKVRCVSNGKNGTIWIGTDGGGVLKWNCNTNKPEKIDNRPPGKDKDSFNVVSTILTDKNGIIWSFGNGTFSKYNPVDDSVKNYIFIYENRSVYEPPGSDVFIDQAFQNDDGTIWFLNRPAGLMFRFDPGTEKLALFKIPHFYVYQCIMDKTGSFWFACVRNNIYRLVTGKIPYLTIPVKNSTHVANIHRGTYLEDNQNRIYFLFLQGTYFCKKFDVHSSLILNQFRFPDGDTIAGGGFKDSKGNLWFGNKKGKITKYDPVTKDLTNIYPVYTPGYPEVVFVPLIREDKNGSIWVADSKELFRVNIEKVKLDHILNFNYKSGNEDAIMLMDFLIDSQGNFWILTSESILSIRMPETEITDYTNHADSVDNTFPYAFRISEDSKGNIFVLNPRYGIYRFNRQNESFIKDGIINSDPGTEYYDLLIDRKDRLWIASNRGITVYDPSDKSSRLIRTPKLEYDIQSCQLKSGEVLFLNNDQLYVFYEDIPSNNYIPPVILTRFRVNGTDYFKALDSAGEISTLKKIDLPYRLNSLSIEFAALNFLNPERNKYRYFMEGFDRDTALIGQGIPAEFKNMPPGRYRFWVTGSNNDGLWNREGLTLDIRIRPPWYRSIISYILYTLSILLFIGAYIRIKIRNLRRDKMKLEAEIKVATAELERKNLQLAEIDRIKTHFFTDISHEIRTPLSLILGPLENLSTEDMPGGRFSGMIDIMKRNAHRLMNLVNQLLDISRLDAGKMKITLIEDDIVRFIKVLVYEFLSMAESKKIKYIADLPEKELLVLFDRDKIEKIVTNLLSNAFKYTPVNGTVQCIVRIEKEDMMISPLLQISVTDTGSGISTEHLTRIFDRFYRVEGDHEEESYGTGIGLSLVQEFVSLLHGKVSVESRPGKGSGFFVTIPLGKDHLSPEEYVTGTRSERIDMNRIPATQTELQEPGITKTSKKNRISLLVIEDNEDLRKFIKETLEYDYIILESENGRTGLNTAFTMMPDLILTDIMMPDLDGLKLCTMLKTDIRTSHIPIIMLTAKATTEDKIAGLKTGADDYIVKPFNIAELIARISNILQLREKLKMKYSKFHLLETGESRPESVDGRFMHQVFKIVQANITNYSFDVRSLTERLGMSRTHLSRKIKILTGLSPGMLIRNIRLEKAAELISCKTGNITEIANSVGMSNPSNFAKAFRNYFGVSPRKYSKN